MSILMQMWLPCIPENEKTWEGSCTSAMEELQINNGQLLFDSHAASFFEALSSKLLCCSKEQFAAVK